MIQSSNDIIYDRDTHNSTYSALRAGVGSAAPDLIMDASVAFKEDHNASLS